MGGRGGGVAGLAAALVLAGCTAAAEPQAKPLPPLTKSPSASASPSPAPRPSRSPVGPTPTSAAAFVRAYYAAVNQAAVRGTKTSFEKLALSTCTRCANYQSSNDFLVARHQRLAAPPLSIADVRPYPLVGNLTTVSVRIIPQRLIFLNAANRVERTLAAARSYFASVAVAWRGDSWIITDITSFGQ